MGSKVFHADRLRKYPNNPLPGQVCVNPEGEAVEPGEEEEWEVYRVTSSRTHYRKLQY